MPARPERETLEAHQALKAILVRGAIPGPWHEDVVARFRRDCSDFLGDHGETILAALAAAPDARLAEALTKAEAELRRVARSPGTPAPGRCERIADEIAAAREET